MFERKNDEGVSENADDDGRDAVEQVGGVANNEGSGAAAEFREINGAKESDGNADKRGHQQELRAAEDGVGHAAAGFADRHGQLGKEVPTNGCSAVINEVAKDEEEDGNRNHGTYTGHGEHEVAHEFAPAKPGVHALPMPAPR